MINNKKKNTRSATTNFGKEEVLKIIIMITITFWTSGDIDPIKLNKFGSRNPIFDSRALKHADLYYNFKYIESV